MYDDFNFLEIYFNFLASIYGGLPITMSNPDLSQSEGQRITS